MFAANAASHVSYLRQGCARASADGRQLSVRVCALFWTSVEQERTLSHHNISLLCGSRRSTGLHKCPVHLNGHVLKDIGFMSRDFPTNTDSLRPDCGEEGLLCTSINVETSCEQKRRRSIKLARLVERATVVQVSIPFPLGCSAPPSTSPTLSRQTNITTTVTSNNVVRLPDREHAVRAPCAAGQQDVVGQSNAVTQRNAITYAHQYEHHNNS